MNEQKIKRMVNSWASLLKNKVFYIPTLGPFYSDGRDIKKLLSDILINAQTNVFLPYDKNKRWYNKKQERILVSDILSSDDKIIIPVIYKKKKILKFFVYSDSGINNLDINIITKMKDRISKNMKCFIGCFKKPRMKRNFIRHNIYFKKITKKDCVGNIFKGIYQFADLNERIKLSFGRLGKEAELEGFGFLWEKHILQNKKPANIICGIFNNKVIGAIGPLDSRQDAWGVSWLLPPYFGVKKQFRGQNWGEKLWKSAMSYAYAQGAKYTLVQNTTNSPAADFYKKQGLVVAGRVYSILIK